MIGGVVLVVTNLNDMPLSTTGLGEFLPRILTGVLAIAVGAYLRRKGRSLTW
jgi:1,4-dihydroxy-2-naphthoate octaprenyltransferase